MNEKIAIMAHHIPPPDGDAVCSMLGVYYLIKDNFGIESDMILDDPAPENFKFLNGVDKIIQTHNMPLDYVPDIAFALDTAEVERLAAAETFKISRRKIKIDHHENSINYGDKNFINPGRSSTCDMIAEMAMRLGWKISVDAANALCAGIVSDTNKLTIKMPPQTLKILDDLVCAGADLERIKSELSKQTRKQFLASSALGENAKYEFDGRLVYCTASREDYNKINITFEELKSSSLVIDLQNIAGVQVSLIFYELNNGGCYISMRGPGDIVPVLPIAQAMGIKSGHTYATGFARPDMKLADAVTKVVGLFREMVFNTK